MESLTFGRAHPELCSCSGRQEPTLLPCRARAGPEPHLGAQFRRLRGHALRRLQRCAASSTGPHGSCPPELLGLAPEASGAASSFEEEDLAGSADTCGLVWTTFVAETLLPTKHGKFRLRGYRHTTDGGRTYTEPCAIISGAPEGCENVAVRVHDACFTSEVLGSLKCDCAEQLGLALAHIRGAPPGMVVYLQQEGRGIGLANKIAAYALQERGLDTVDANRALGLPDDCREYSPVAFILNELRVASIQLMTNNPRKISEVEALGVRVTGRIPCLVQAQEYSAGYLAAKERRMSHIMGAASGEASEEEEEVGSGGGRRAGPSAADLAGFSGTSPAARRQRARMVSEQHAQHTRQVLEAAAPGGVVAGEGPEDVELDGSFCFWNHEGEPGSAGIPLGDEPPM